MVVCFLFFSFRILHLHFKPFACSSYTPQEWVQFSQYNVARAQEAMQVSQQMREDMSLTRAQVCVM